MKYSIHRDVYGKLLTMKSINGTRKMPLEAIEFFADYETLIPSPSKLQTAPKHGGQIHRR